MKVLKLPSQSALAGKRPKQDVFQWMDRKDLRFETEGIPRLDQANWCLGSWMAAWARGAGIAPDLPSPLA